MTTMELPKNAFKRALKEGRNQIGLWSSLSSNYTVEVIAGAGYDWILLDQEHSPNDLESLLAQLQAAAPYPASAVVRVPWNEPVSKPGSPCSATVGVLEAEGTRCALEMPIARSRPPVTEGQVASMPLNSTCAWPPTTAVTASAPPLYGM